MNRTRPIKACIWCYLVLLIFEGALRKWVLPGLSDVLLVVRDPIVLCAILISFVVGKLRLNGYLAITAFVALVSPLFAMTAGHGNMVVTAFGWRANFLHFPFIFVMASTLTSQDVKKMGEFLMALSVPMVLLMAAQFYSPMGSFVNLGLGGIGDSGFSGALGYRRPSGTFSFNSGVGMFFPYVAAFVMAFAMQPTARGKWLAILAGIATFAAMPISLSRYMVLSIALVGVGAAFALLLGGRSVVRLFQVSVILAFMGIGVTFIPGLEKPREAFLSRWEASTTSQGGFENAIVGRSVQSLSAGLLGHDGNLLAGAGLGMGTNVGAQVLSGEQVFLISEAEWGRLTGEMGIPLGLVFIGVRVTLALRLLLAACRLAKAGHPLALLLWFACVQGLVAGQWGQPSTLGFAIFGTGLAFAVVHAHYRETDRGQSWQPQAD